MIVKSSRKSCTFWYFKAFLCFTQQILDLKQKTLRLRANVKISQKREGILMMLFR